MTLQEAKDKVAKNHGQTSWNDWAQAYAEPYGKAMPEAIQDEAAELYACSKWDEACTLTNRNIIHHTKLSLSDLPAKPEFKP